MLDSYTAKALRIKPGVIWFTKILARMEDSESRKEWYNDEHVKISASNDATSDSDERMICLISAGRPSRECKSGGGVAVGLEDLCSLEDNWG